MIPEPDETPVEESEKFEFAQPVADEIAAVPGFGVPEHAAATAPVKRIYGLFACVVLVVTAQADAPSCLIDLEPFATVIFA